MLCLPPVVNDHERRNGKTVGHIFQIPTILQDGLAGDIAVGVVPVVGADDRSGGQQRVIAQPAAELMRGGQRGTLLQWIALRDHSRHHEPPTVQADAVAAIAQVQEQGDTFGIDLPLRKGGWADLHAKASEDGL